MRGGRALLVLAVVATMPVADGPAFGAETKFIPLGRDKDDLEARTALWFRPDLGTESDILPLKTRVWATKESVTGGVAMKCVFEKGSKAMLAMEVPALPAGSAGITFYAKASRALKLAVNNLPCEAGTEWKKIDIPWERFGTTKEKPQIGWQLVVKAAEPIEGKTCLVLDRIGIESPEFDPNPKIEPQSGPDTVLSSKDMLYGAENLAKTLALLKEKKPFKIIALGDSVTAGAQMMRSTWGVTGAKGVPFLYFSHLARLLEDHNGYKGIKPVQRGHGGWTAAKAMEVVDKEVVAEASADDLVILQFGTNDMSWAGVTPEGWKDATKKLIARVKTKTDQILILSPTSCDKVTGLGDKIAAILKEIAAEEKVAAADVTKLMTYRGEPFAWAMLANSGHPDYMGHISIAEMIAPILTGQHRNYPE